jgi:hypothetical protein
MPTYTLGLPDGRKIQIEADAPEKIGRASGRERV